MCLASISSHRPHSSSHRPIVASIVVSSPQSSPQLSGACRQSLAPPLSSTRIASGVRRLNAWLRFFVIRSASPRQLYSQPYRPYKSPETRTYLRKLSPLRPAPTWPPPHFGCQFAALPVHHPFRAVPGTSTISWTILRCSHRARGLVGPRRLPGFCVIWTAQFARPGGY